MVPPQIISKNNNKIKGAIYLHNLSTNIQRFAWSEMKQEVQSPRWLCVLKEQIHTGPRGTQLNFPEVFALIQYSLVQYLPSCQKIAPPTVGLYTVWVHPAVLMWMHYFQLWDTPARAYDHFLPLLTCESSIWAEWNIFTLPLPPPPRIATTPALCIQQTLSEHLLYTRHR